MLAHVIKRNLIIRQVPLKIMLLLGSLTYGSNAWAYIGPGAGLGMMGSLITVALVALVTIFGLVFLPLRWYMAKKRRQQEQQGGDGDSEDGNAN